MNSGKNGIQTHGEYFSSVKNNKFIDDLVFKSPFRCAENVMNTYKINNWHVALRRGFSVIAVTFLDKS